MKRTWLSCSTVAKPLPQRGSTETPAQIQRMLLALCSLIALSPGSGLGQPLASESTPIGLVAAAPNDPYRPLAEEIASQTGYRLMDSPLQALSADPLFLVWIISPAMASDHQFVSYGQAIKSRNSAISLGIITGSTLEAARALWNHRLSPAPSQWVAINSLSKDGCQTEGGMEIWRPGQRTVCSPTLESMQTVLRESGYVTFSGHGTPASLVLSPSIRLRTSDVPKLPSLVMGTSSCNTLRFWTGQSIALAFLDQGAAAYAGFVFSPNSGYLMGANNGLPFRYTWPDFPIGHAVQVLNRGCSQGFAAFPFYHLLGDPRRSLSSGPCYQVAEDAETNDARKITVRGAPAGVLPIRVPHGAAYSYVRIPGVTAASTSDWLYNSRLQMANLRDDKLLLFLHNGGDFSVELYRSAPPGWAARDIFVDSLDHSLIYNSQGRTNLLIQFITGSMVLGGVGWKFRRAERRAWMAGWFTGLAFVILIGLFAWARLDHVTITSKPLAFPWLALPGFYCAAMAGSLVYFQAQHGRGRLLGLLLASAYQILSTLGILLMLLTMDAVISRRLGSPIWNYRLLLPNLVAFILLLAAYFVSFEGIRCWLGVLKNRPLHG